MRGQPQFLTGGTARERDPRRSGETPEPTVTVRMGEGAPIGARSEAVPSLGGAFPTSVVAHPMNTRGLGSRVFCGARDRVRIGGSDGQMAHDEKLSR